MRSRMMWCVAFVVLLLSWIPLHGQNKDYDWYPEFRRWERRLVRAGENREATSELYRQKLQADHVDAAEIERRLVLLRTKRNDLENDFWTRTFTEEERQPKLLDHNAFLASVVEGRKPGTALDVGMGNGRNSIYLAKLGWDVTGFDPSDGAVAFARKHAAALNVPLHTVITDDTTFDFGHERWDLIVYTFVPLRSVPKAIDALRSGGILVIEEAPRMLADPVLKKAFESLHILHNDELASHWDNFMSSMEMPTVRFAAEKPASK